MINKGVIIRSCLKRIELYMFVFQNCIELDLLREGQGTNEVPLGIIEEKPQEEQFQAQWLLILRDPSIKENNACL